MRLSSSLSDLWNWNAEGAFIFAEPQPNICEYADRYGEWIGWLFEDIVTDKPTIITISQAKVVLQDRYHEWRHSVPTNHRDRLSSRGHICIYQVYVDAYNRLRQEELSLRPAILFEPTKPPPPPNLPPGTLGGIIDDY